MRTKALSTTPVSKTQQTCMMPPDETTLEGDDRAGDARLVEETKRGKRDAFGTLVRRYERRLLRVIGRFIRDPDIAEDLAQETFLRVYERIEQFDPSRRFAPWLFQIGVNLTLDYHRRQKRRRRIWSFFFIDHGGDKYPDPASPDPRNEQDLHEEIRSVIETIPEQFRTVLVLRDLEGFSTGEIAAILDRKEATIRWRLAEARTRFQEAWTRRQPKS